MRRREVARTLLGEALLEVRYEDVRSDPAQACRRLFAHCGMPHDEELVSRAVEATEFGHEDRPRGEDQPLRAGQVGAVARALRDARGLVLRAARRSGARKDRLRAGSWMVAPLPTAIAAVSSPHAG